MPCIFKNFCGFTFQYVSIISQGDFAKEIKTTQFTFQYVSIISEIAGGSEAYTKHLHSNMFLLFQRILCILAKRK